MDAALECAGSQRGCCGCLSLLSAANVKAEALRGKKEATAASCRFGCSSCLTGMNGSTESGMMKRDTPTELSHWSRAECRQQAERERASTHDTEAAHDDAALLCCCDVEHARLCLIRRCTAVDVGAAVHRATKVTVREKEQHWMRQRLNGRMGDELSLWSVSSVPPLRQLPALPTSAAASLHLLPCTVDDAALAILHSAALCALITQRLLRAQLALSAALSRLRSTPCLECFAIHLQTAAGASCGRTRMSHTDRWAATRPTRWQTVSGSISRISSTLLSLLHV